MRTENAFFLHLVREILKKWRIVFGTMDKAILLRILGWYRSCRRAYGWTYYFLSELFRVFSQSYGCE